MKYYTVKEISDQIGENNIHEVTQGKDTVSIQIKGGLQERDCDTCKTGKHLSPSVRPRVTIRSF